MEGTKMSAFVKSSPLDILNKGFQSAWDEGYAQGFENASKLMKERDAAHHKNAVAFVEKVSALEEEIAELKRSKQAEANSIPPGEIRVGGKQYRPHKAGYVEKLNDLDSAPDWEYIQKRLTKEGLPEGILAEVLEEKGAWK